MMLPSEELSKLRKEARKLRRQNSSTSRSRDAHKKQCEHLEQKVSEQGKRIKKLLKEKQGLKKEIQELKSRLGIEVNKVVKYTGMLFKSSIRKKPTTVGRGGKAGHKGNSRKKPERIDREVNIYLTNCYHCGTSLNQTSSTDEHIIEDIPQVITTITRYLIQRQWCTNCHKEVRGIPGSTIPGSRFGIGVLILIITLKYRLRTPLKKIEELLKEQYNLSITSQGIQQLLHIAKTKFTKQYNDILQEIRDSPVKHADETGYRIDGVNGWCWLFATQKVAFYTIEETRGKSVPHRIFGRDPTGVLVRDDCPSYKALPMQQQSCWAHLLRVSHEATEKEDASSEVNDLHKELRVMFKEIDSIRIKSLKPRMRKEYFNIYLAKIDVIIEKAYHHKDAQTIQTRISNQRERLLTTLLYDNVPMTNNHAERMIRPMVITRKISGCSRSDKGASTHSVNMSVMQTLALQGKNFFEGISEILHAENPRYTLGKG
jgi:transposase